MPRTQQELEQLLDEQLDFLAVSAEAFDEGVVAEAKRMATTCRVLFRDGKPSGRPRERVSVSLLTQLGQRQSLLLADNAGPADPEAASFTMRLWRMSVGPRSTRNEPNLQDSGRRTPFEQWWSWPVERHARGIEINRSDVVSWLGEQDGGAHVEPSLREPYATVSRPGYAWMGVTEKSDSTMLYVMRGIAHEVLLTLGGPERIT